MLGLLVVGELVAAPPRALGLEDEREQALKALAILGADVPGSTGRCASCHEINVINLERWRQAAQILQWSCMENSSSTPQARIDCLRNDAADPQSPFQPAKLGLFAAGVHTSKFEDLFRAAYPDGAWVSEYNAFRTAAQMPIGGVNPMSPEDFTAVLEWTLKGMPYMVDILGSPGDAPTTCTNDIKPEFVEHIEKMAVEGWGAKNRDASMLMFGCATGADALDCLNQKDGAGNDLFPDVRATSYGVDWAKDMPEAKFRILRPLPYDTSYWMRSSANGRFVANGANSDSSDPDGSWGGRISDLNPQLVAGSPLRDIKVAAAFDPGFFPDDSGFMFQATPVGSGFCRLSILENPATTSIDFSQSECSGAKNINLYQAIGASLDGSDYMAISGSFAGDSGSGSGRDGEPAWGASSFLTVVPIVNDGLMYRSLPEAQVFAPWLGDWGLSPSNLVTASRVAGVDGDGNAKQMGYKFHFLQRVPSDTGYSATLVEAGTVCTSGVKGAFSFDERFYTVYHYVAPEDYAEMGFTSPDDPAFKALLEGSANVKVIDLKTGKVRRVTRMGPKQFAYFPHFRSDGWIYYMIYDQTTGERYVAATDAAIRMSRKVSTP